MQVLLIIPLPLAVTAAWNLVLNSASVMGESGVAESETMTSNFPEHQPLLLSALGLINLTFFA